MQHIEAMTAVAASKGRLLESLKNMIVDTMLQDRISIGEPPTHHKNVDLWADLQSLQEFKKIVPKLREGLQSHYALQDSRVALVSHEAAMRSVIQEAQAKAEEADEVREGKERELKELEARHDEERHRINGEIIRHQQAVELESNRIQGLEDDLEKWEAEDIARSKEGVASIPDLQSRLTGAEKDLEVMTSKVANIQGEFDKRKTDTQQQFRQDQTRLQGRWQEIATQLKNLIERQGEELSALHKRQAQDIESLDQEAGEKADELQGAISDLQDERMRSASPLEEEQAQLDDSARAIENAQTAVTNAEGLRDNARDDFAARQKERGEAVRAHEGAARTWEIKKSQFDALTRQLYPEDGTLLAFLRNSELPWHDTLGKVLDPALLARRDLSPALAENPNLEQVFGITLELDDVSRPDAAEQEDVLLARLEKSKVAVRSAKEDAERLEVKAQQASSDLKKADQAKQMAENRLEQAEGRLRQAKASDTSLRHRIGEEQKARVLEVEERLEVAQKALTSHQNAAKALRDNRKRDHDAQYQQAIADHQLDKGRLEDEQASVEASQTDLKHREKVALKKLGDWLEQAMSDEGVDTRVIRETSELVDTLKDDIAEAERLRPRVSEYDAWLRDQWSHKTAYETALSKAEGMLAREQNALEAAKTAYRDAHKTLNAARDEAERKVRTLKAEISDDTRLADTVAQTIMEIPLLPTTDAPAGEVTVRGREQLNDELARLHGVAEHQRQNVLQSARRCGTILAQHPGSKIFQSWQNMREDRRSRSQHEEGTHAFTLEQMQDLEALLEHRVPEIEKGVIVNVHAIGSELSDYHESLKTLDSSTKSITRRLDNHLNTSHEFTVISDVSLKVKSKIHEFGFWRELADFASAWADWAVTGFTELPGEALLQRLTNIDGQLKHARMSTHDLRSMVELEIEFFEQDRRVPIRTDNDLNASGSQGISRLAILVLFSALARYLCPDERVNITWPIDELGELAPENSVKLFRMMDDRNISLFCAEPRITTDLLRYFENKVLLDKRKGVMSMVPKESNTHNPLLAGLVNRAAPEAPAPSPETEEVLDTHEAVADSQSMTQESTDEH
ncbi:ATP-binding protein [Halomonas urmiana]|uniref:ATP-binding protein n=1 Tax=Halomonas urmiana TaxID=490901 RepID=A0A5R8MN56_9GAMM|nr:ATP-binding protein [Halomonas urmiana]TLF52751.1 ATP-binding protein [Halomonas urmiana]